MFDKIKITAIALLISLIIPGKIIATDTKLGEWQDYLSYTHVKKIVDTDDRVYCMTSNSLFYYDKTDNSINTISKVQGLTANNFANIAYWAEGKMLIVVYEDLCIDFVQNNKVAVFPYIKNKTGINNKTINDIMLYNNRLYLATGFGIVVIDLQKQLVEDTYTIGIGNKSEAVFSLAFDNTYFYASSKNMIFRAKKDEPYLADQSRWEFMKSTETEFVEIESFASKLFAIVKNPTVWAGNYIIAYDGNAWSKAAFPFDDYKTLKVSNNKLVLTGFKVYTADESMNLSSTATFDDALDATIDKNNVIWIADQYKALIKYMPDGQYEVKSPNCPMFNSVQSLDIADNQMWTVTGSNNEWANQWSKQGFSSYINNKWNSVNVYKEDHNPLLDSIYDFVDVKINPSNPSQVYMATWQKGLVKYENDQITIYNAGIGNSTIGENKYWPGRYFVSSLSYDAYGNLWMTNPRNPRPLSVLKTDGKWKSFAIPDLSSDYYKVDKLVATSWGDIWITNISSSNLYVYTYKGTLDAESDDDKKPFSLSNLVNEGNALIASTVVYCIVEDRDGNLWVGTDAGPVVISNGRYFFDNSASAYKIKVALNTEDNSAVFLLESERINCIAVDGANRKWIGTQNSGVYLVSPDGITQIKHFTAENSPLFTNTVIDIKINSNTGEVFFVTDRGMISYRSDATKGSDEFGNVYVFPNPVREDYTGDIAITNLITDAIVKITDISGNLVYQTRAKGGQATWDGKNMRGMRVNTGVYLVFCSNDDGTKTFVTKLLFIH